jgi:hydroxyethylthiazole kinase-like sugar kinase family protein
MLLGALAGWVVWWCRADGRVCVFNVAAEIAAGRDDVRGPGTFRAALLDELYNLTPEILRAKVKVEIVEC